MRAHNRLTAAATALPLMLALCASAAGAAENAKGLVAELHDASGKSAGKVTLKVSGNHLMGTIRASGLTPGDHGMHVHAIGKCEGPAFTTAGGHLNPDGKQHGLNNPQGTHQGDMPQLAVGSNGKARQKITVNSTVAAILDADGGAFVVHAKADDQVTDPSGNSGDRILCGVFKPTR
jgi:Cu-Zn family superoxide dismutase